MAQLLVCSLITAIAVIVYEVHSIEDDVIMTMPLVDVGGNHILIFTFEPFVGKLFADFMRLFRGYFTYVKGLNQMTGDHLRNLHTALGGKISCPLKFLRSSITGCAAK